MERFKSTARRFYVKPSRVSKLRICGLFSLLALLIMPQMANAQTIPARDSKTLSRDVAVTNACVRSGGSKSHCLCVVSVLKYDLTLREYEAASALYIAEKSGKSSELMATRLALIQQDYSAEEITATNAMRRNLTQSPDLQDRCVVAQDYFEQQ